MADELLARLEKIDWTDFPTPTLNDLYDIIHMLLDARFISSGIRFRGEGAHHELIEEAAYEGKITEKERVLLQQIREIRNRYKYEGFSIGKDFLERNSDEIYMIIRKLR
ncbi:MAG: hypothetical protein ACLFNK_00890 [Candidatus Woesearchaeota archaeon]